LHARTLLWASEHMRFILCRMFPQCTSVSAYFLALNVRRFDISPVDVIFSVLIYCFDEEERISVSICRLWANVLPCKTRKRGLNMAAGCCFEPKHRAQVLFIPSVSADKLLHHVSL